MYMYMYIYIYIHAVGGTYYAYTFLHSELCTHKEYLPWPAITAKRCTCMSKRYTCLCTLYPPAITAKVCTYMSTVIYVIRAIRCTGMLFIRSVHRRHLGLGFWRGRRSAQCYYYYY